MIGRPPKCRTVRKNGQIFTTFTFARRLSDEEMEKVIVAPVLSRKVEREQRKRRREKDKERYLKEHELEDKDNDDEEASDGEKKEELKGNEEHEKNK